MDLSTEPARHPEGATNMDMRTRIQEMKYGQALGYAWGRKDASNAREDIVLDSGAFATFYSMLEDLGRHHRVMAIQDAYAYFRALKLEEQKAYGDTWMRRPWSMYEEMMKERQGTHG
jgi:hypothetical protein